MTTEVEAEASDQHTIVAIAASAGGLEATSLLAQNLPASISCTYVIAQHMSPSHKSMLVQLLSRETKLGVEELKSETYPQDNVIYIPPPGRDVIYQNGGFHLREPSTNPATPKPSADRLFKSLAEEIGEHTIGIVLSGTGSDGSYGVQAIREHGGITIAQEPLSSKYDSMPSAAIRTGCVDLTLTPQQIGEHIEAIISRPTDTSIFKDLEVDHDLNRDLYEILLSRVGVDFRQYKETTVNRRIHRRMLAKGIDSIEDYTEFCRQSIDEVEALYRDLLISVTRFFRDPEQFAELANSIRAICRKREKDKPIRVWVPGCATGEEAYTIAILFCEQLGGLETIKPDDLQIFATDLDDEALARGRKGAYPVAATADIPDGRFQEYFDYLDDQIVISPRLRRMVMFSRHNVFQDAPFIDIDLVSIRNVLIYFSARLQERVLTRIVYALKPGGTLFLGTSETLGSMNSSFTQSNNARIFQKRDVTEVGQDFDLPINPEKLMGEIDADKKPNKATRPSSWMHFDRLASVVVKDGMIVNRERTVLRVYGDIAPYCEMTNTSLGQTTLSMLKRSLSADASSLALVALKYREMREGQWHQLPGDPEQATQITAYPLSADDDLAEDLVLLGFKTVQRGDTKQGDVEESEYVNFLEDELSRNRDALQVTVEQLQTSNEELQALNEELQSSNEELQSTNEELETSNEELQSTNEELITVNEELMVNAGQLERTTAELHGLIESLPTVSLMVDQGLIVRYASQSARQLFSLKERGGGFGHLSQVALPPAYPQLLKLCSKVLLERKSLEEPFDENGNRKSLRVAPLTDNDARLFGLVIEATEAA